MTTRANYDPFWIPGLDQDVVSLEQGLETGFAWLTGAEQRYGGTGVLVMNAASMRRNNPLLESAPWEIVSRLTRRHIGAGPVLAIYPSARTLEFAESLARGSGLCVIGGSLFDLAPWIRRTGAQPLVPGVEIPSSQGLPEEVAEQLRHVLFFGGHNSFLGGGEKEVAIRALRKIAQRPDAPSREAIEAYMLTTGDVDSDGATRAGKWYDEILRGTRHRDYRGQTIR